MPSRDPSWLLVRLVMHLEERLDIVTADDITLAAKRRRVRSLSAERLDQLIRTAVDDELLLPDRRTFFDRQTGQFSDRDVYRVNWRHPLIRDAR